MNNQNNDSNMPLEVIEKQYTFRRLCAKDIPTVLNILKKVKINRFAECFQSEQIKKLITNSQNDEKMDIVTGSTIFLELAQILIDGIAECGDEIFKLLSDTSNLTVKQVEALDFEVFTEMVIDFVKKEEFVGFFKAVSKLIQ